MHHAIGLVELNSIAKGIEVTDTMLKSAHVELLSAKTICPGKYIVMVGGEIAAVKQSVTSGEQQGGHMTVDSFVLPNVHPSILPALSGVTIAQQRQSIGVVETYSVATCINAADAAIKAANVELIRIHMAFGIGGKCYLVVNGDVSDVNTAVAVASVNAGENGLLVHGTVIPKPHPDVWRQLL
ncbi:BMC domain-containing protein [Vibrio mangrovi]|uniref:BMC domain-containing protein n=1 Tax=Vibrio mangrovi TaxID=474394 RepID=A0A1Y6IY78_9VIBR|nr:BMC domain-containing protein [Vibrio mangrovi]MDW6005171.1 BMC domain-containing protein [Vibrio mangrovi]SMS02619.1 Ethanolamine utilization protein EutM precursor [Vibrio mangrovi]